MRKFYGVCFVAGCVLPLVAFLPWVAQNGLTIPLLVREAAATPISRFAWLDVLVSAVVLLGWIVMDGLRGRVRFWWLAAILTLTIGVSAGLPLHLYLREPGRRSN